MQKPEIELLTFARVSQRVSFGRSTIYQRIKDGTFPRPVSLGPHCVRWRSDSIDAWIEAQSTQDDAVHANVARAKKASSARQQKNKPNAVALATKA